MGNKKWSELHLDIFDSILEKVATSLPGIIRCKAVCSSWNYGVKLYMFAPYYYANHDQAPLLMHCPTNEETDRVCFFSMAEKKVYKMNFLVEENGCIYSGRNYTYRNLACASHGWMVVWDYRDNETKQWTWLLNPISSSKILIPVISTLVHCFTDDMRPTAGLILKTVIKGAVVSSDPSQSNNNNFVVVVLYNIKFIRKGSLAFCKPGDNAWTSLGNYEYCDSMEFNNGQLFTLFVTLNSKSSNRIIRIWDLRSGEGESYDYNNLMKPPIVIRPCMEVVDRYLPPVRQRTFYRNYYLVKSVGELLLVEQFYDCWEADECGKEVSAARSGCISIGTEGKCEVWTPIYYFYVFKLNVDSNEWEKVEYLHRRALCLNEDGLAISISTQNILDFEENSIYFIHKTIADNGIRVGAVYNMETRVIKPFYTYGHDFRNRGMWMVPNPW